MIHKWKSNSIGLIDQRNVIKGKDNILLCGDPNIHIFMSSVLEVKFKIAAGDDNLFQKQFVSNLDYYH